MSERREREGEHQLVEDTGWLDLDAAEASADDFAWRDRELPTIWRVTHATLPLALHRTPDCTDTHYPLERPPLGPAHFGSPSWRCAHRQPSSNSSRSRTRSSRPYSAEGTERLLRPARA